MRLDEIREPMLPKGTPVMYKGKKYVVAIPNDSAEDTMLAIRDPEDPGTEIYMDGRNQIIPNLHWVSYDDIEVL